MKKLTTSLSLESIKEEARFLIATGCLERRKPLLCLCEYIPCREWVELECELERNDFLLRDSIADLVESETWDED
ncbi:DUF4327 family protein [Gloeothece verrucosa]|uniref:DUF4327 domain-containing protein n=1 Tax=Gloeothece verrucosa (strain PCC 7822) TaxID=497965 RepID=E0U8Q9_GLOV7|nr:DUF4327 family protein [Gloeothece verrucosa]ADN14923.1 conserved hypothetical protein [Gloeothece verrucosa PCC 7822]